MTDHYAEAEKLLAVVNWPTREEAIQMSIARGLLALVDGVEELIAHLTEEEDEEDG